MRLRLLTACCVAFSIAACSSGGTDDSAQSSTQTTAQTTALATPLSGPLQTVAARAVRCDVVAAELGQARRQFTAQCGGKPRDCDPNGNQWMCASYVIGTSAPDPQSGNANGDTDAVTGSGSDTGTVPGSCTVRASTLQAARDAYASQCDLPRLDCDPIEGQWQCSSQQLGQRAPQVAGEPAVTESFDDSLDGRVRTLISAASGGRGLAAFTLPETGDLDAIPQDPNNPLTTAKVALGQLLFHDTSFALNGRMDESESWSCATCHHAAAGFKSGIRQGIGNGGVGFGANGSARLLAAGFDGNALTDADNLPDLQPFASPSILHSAWQDVMLWNGQFGNSANGIVNAGVDPARLLTPGTPKAVNETGLSGVEVQAIAGSGVHRLKFGPNPQTVLQTNTVYQELWEAAYGNEFIDPLEGAGKAMAAFERTVIANEAPFQHWLRGDKQALSELQLRGAELFFGRAGCVECHRGPGLGSDVGAMADNMFFALGFSDLDETDAIIHGTVSRADRLGRGGFTGNPADNFKFKIPQLYNIKDANVMGHGASFDSVRAVIEYKNAAVPQHVEAKDSLDHRFQPLDLTELDIDALTAFISDGLNDPDLLRYQPVSVPSGGCIIVNAHDDTNDGLCP